MRDLAELTAFVIREIFCFIGSVVIVLAMMHGFAYFFAAAPTWILAACATIVFVIARRAIKELHR